MAKKVQIVLIDDVDGAEANETVKFGLDGVSYEIDLSADNAAALRNDLAKWVGSAERTGGRMSRGSGAKSTRQDLSEMRDWARANGYHVSDRGRISAEIKEAYRKAH
ncbi:MAG: Lsr2 family protein [Nostocoides sp.]